MKIHLVTPTKSLLHTSWTAVGGWCVTAGWDSAVPRNRDAGEVGKDSKLVKLTGALITALYLLLTHGYLMKYTDLSFDKSVWGFFLEKRGNKCIRALTRSKIRGIRIVWGSLSRQSSHELMMTLGLLPPMSDMTDRQPSGDM